MRYFRGTSRDCNLSEPPQAELGRSTLHAEEWGGAHAHTFAKNANVWGTRNWESPNSGAIRNRRIAGQFLHPGNPLSEVRRYHGSTCSRRIARQTAVPSRTERTVRIAESGATQGPRTDIRRPVHYP